MAHRAVQAVCEARASPVSSPKEGDAWVERCAAWVASLSSRNESVRLEVNTPQIVYESATLPGLSIEKYTKALRHTAAHFKLPDATKCWAATFILINRFVEKFPTILTPYTEHRIVLVAFLVAMKVTSEKRLSNTNMAKYGGVTVGNLNEMERTFLLDMDFETYISREEFEMSAEMPFAVSRSPVTSPREWVCDNVSFASARSEVSMSEEGSPRSAVSQTSSVRSVTRRLKTPRAAASLAFLAVDAAPSNEVSATRTESGRRLGTALDFSRSVV